MVAEIVVVEEVNFRCAMNIFVTGTTIMLNNVRIPTSSIWRIVNLCRLLREFCMGPLHSTNLSRGIEMISALNAFSCWIWLKSAIIHNDIGVSTGSISLICSEFLMVCTTQSEKS